MGPSGSRTALIREKAKARNGSAEGLLAGLLRDLFQIEAQDVAINYDQYSLNSLNGFFSADGKQYFFKFHQEEHEEDMSGEYYRADILAKAGLPVDQPIMISQLPGEQILVYKRRTDPRFSDFLRSLDEDHDDDLARLALDAEHELNEAVLAVYLKTLHPVTPEQVAQEPIHRLFHDRLVSVPEDVYPGGRLSNFYVSKVFRFPGLDLSWDILSKAHFVINGINYRNTLAELFDAAHERLAPSRLDDSGGVTAHGDAHNANVWFEIRDGHARLAFFDPAFAGEHVPTLLAEVKTTFHNILAHPYWLYDPAIAQQKFNARARYENGVLYANFDWELTPVRAGLLKIKAESMWRPLLAALKDRGLLPADWQKVIRLGLFLCPTLVMNLRADATSHNPTSSLIGLSVATMLGSEPCERDDLVSHFLSMIDPEARS
ncbi:hypothetical protein [Oryzifoliimicrobium ureilyticus]|uniref:hypothetical protein n=1 Tax=Oryzifoliimicrobium ureilyticus TaxID=3113724 RepID=UPI00307675D9